MFDFGSLLLITIVPSGALSGIVCPDELSLPTKLFCVVSYLRVHA